MRMIRVCAACLAVTVVTLLGAAAEAQQLQKSGKYTGKFGGEAVGQSYELEKGHAFFVGMFHGVFFNDMADGFLDKTQVTCPEVVDNVEGRAVGGQGDLLR